MTRIKKSPRYKMKKRLLQLIFLADIAVIIFLGAQFVKHLSYYIDLPSFMDITGYGDLLFDKEERVYPQEFVDYLENNSLSEKDFPDDLLNIVGKKPELYDYICNYPMKKDSYTDEALSEDVENEVPLLMQWDDRWGYYDYGSGKIGYTGCGPTCLSMVASHLLNDKTMTPIKLAEFAKENRYCVKGHGTKWALMSEGAEKLGLKASELSLDENIVTKELKEGHPIICIVGPGDFTSTGHFIVLTGIDDEGITVNDPNSRVNSAKKWQYSDIESQIKNLWGYQL